MAAYAVFVGRTGVAFSFQMPVRFGDVDHAGVVYYPRFFQYFHNTFEELILSGGFDYRALLDERRLGFPTVHASCDYRRPLRWGDRLDVAIEVLAIGKSAATFRYRGSRGADLVCEATIKVACTNLDRFAAVPWPDDLRALWTRHLVAVAVTT